VLRRERLVIVGPGQQNAVTQPYLDRLAGGESLHAVRDDEAGFRGGPDQSGNVLKGHAFPGRVQIAPGGDAVDVHRRAHGGQLAKPARFSVGGVVMRP
jgi:hypothetical protein